MSLAAWARLPAEETDVPPDERARRQPAPWTEASLLAGASCAGYALLGAALTLGLGSVRGNALARVANAFYVLYSRDPHPAAIGFAWNPLPSLLEMPLLLLHGFWPALARDGLAANLVSALAGGCAVLYLDRLLGRLGVGRAGRVALVLLCAANPMAAYYAADGMPQMMLAATLVAALDGVAAYLDQGRPGRLVPPAFWLAAGFLVSSQAAVFALLIGLALVLGLLRQGRVRAGVTGVVLLLWAPGAYVAYNWSFLNWMIMGNPAAFLDARFGGGRAGAGPALAAALHHPLGAAVYAAARTMFFPPVLLGVAAASQHALGRARDPRSGVLLSAAVTVFLLQAGLAAGGWSQGLDRADLLYIPTGFLLLGDLAGRARGGRLGPWVLCLCVLLAAAGDAATLTALRSPGLGRGDRAVLAGVLAGRRQDPFAGVDAVDAYLARRPRLTVLVDTSGGNAATGFGFYAGVLRAADPRQFVIPSDRDFARVLRRPWGRVGAILVPHPRGWGAGSAPNRAYPGLWAGRDRWARLLAAFPGRTGWRLYAVRASPPGPTTPAAAGPPAPARRIPAP